MKHGISKRQLDILKRILAVYANHITRVDLFGSRATGRFRNESDIDLVVHGSLTDKNINRLWTLFHESSLPVSVDVKSYELTKHAPLKAHMDKVCKRLFTQEELQAVTKKSG